MSTRSKLTRHLLSLTIALVGSTTLLFVLPAPVVVGQETPPANFKIAFIGDQSTGPNAVAVLNLIKAEGAHVVMHSGDLDYGDNPAAWDAQINSVLGANFPYFVSIGNHDELAWSGPTGYQHYLENRFGRLGITWTGQLGVKSNFYYQGIFFVLTAPGIESGFDDGSSPVYIRDQLAADRSLWSICSWHKNMTLMQVGFKPDETGWGVYEEARAGGAIIATAHEHSYSRTHLLSSMINQTVASTSNTLSLTKGNSFAFVSGLGGSNVREQNLSGNWWASIYAATCLPADQVCQPNATNGALFGVFNVDGQANKARFYFKDINGAIVDSFVVVSNVETFFINGISPSSATVGGHDFILTVDGAGFGSSSVVQVNGVARPTTFISPSRLTITITQADIAAAGALRIAVTKPGLGGGTTNAVTLAVNAPPAPTLLTEAGSSRAVAFDSVTRMREPFSITSPYNFSLDKRTRIALFAADVDLMSAPFASVVTAQAEDSQNRVYALPVEFVGKVPGFSWLTQVIVKLPDALENAGEVRISINVRGTNSNKVLISVGPSLSLP